MPYTVAKRKLHASLRSYLIKALLLIPKGIIRESNIHLLSAARNIAARMNATELEAALQSPPHWPDWLTQDLARSVYTDPDASTAAPEAPPPPAIAAAMPRRSKRVLDRAADNYTSSHRLELTNQAKELKEQHDKYKRRTVQSIRSSLGYKAFKGLSFDAQEPYVAAIGGARIRTKSGIFRVATDDERPLAALLPREELPPLPSPAKAKLRQSEFAEIGKAVLGAALISPAKLTRTLLSSTALAIDADSKFGKRAFKAVTACLPRRDRARVRRDEQINEWNKGGRPKGTTHLTDAELDTILRKHSRESCRWSFRHDKPFRCLDASVLRVWESEELLNCKVAYTTLARRLRQGRLGFSCAKNRCDICPICACWDVTLGPQLETFYKDSEQHLRAEVLGLFAVWDVSLGTDIDKQNRRCESVEYLESYALYLRNSRGEHNDYCQHQIDFVLESIEKPDGWMEILKDFRRVAQPRFPNSHFKIKNEGLHLCLGVFEVHV